MVRAYIRIAFASIVFSLLCCSKSEEEIDLPSTAPIVSNNSLHEVQKEENTVYAQGLSHQTQNSSSSSTLSLKLDIYQPVTVRENRPVFVFVHGGGFIAGTKEQQQIIRFANYYASRGWVFISIDYRLREDRGTVPEEWIDFAETLPGSDASQFLAIYPAHRDAKAAMRWIVANSDIYQINPDYITVGGGSAGAIIAITLGVSEPGDYRDELNLSQDPSLSSTNLNQSFEVHTIIDLWGSKIGLDALEFIYDHQRFDQDDPPLLIVHGTEDPIVPFSNAEDLRSEYLHQETPLAYYPPAGQTHGAWNATVDGKRLEDLAFEFIVEQQGLQVQ